MKMKGKHRSIEFTRKKFNAQFYLLFLVSMVILIVDRYYSDYFAKKSILLTSYFQKWKIRGVVQVLEFVQFKLIVGFFFLMYIFAKEFLISLEGINLFCWSLYIQGMMRFFFADSRPIFNNPQMGELHGHCDYGKPSAKIFILTTLFIWMFRQSTRKYVLNGYWQFLLIFVMLVYLATMMFTQIYQGTSAFHQLIIGASFGALFVEFQLKFEDVLQFYIILPIVKKDKLQLKNPIIYILGLFTFMNTSAFLTWSHMYNKFENLDNSFFKFRNCFDCLENLEINFSTSVMNKMLTFNLMFGMYLGIYLMPGKVYNFGRYMNESRVKQLTLRFVFYVTFISPLFIVDLYATKNPYIIFSNSLLSTLLSGYLITNPLLKIMKYLSNVKDEFIVEKTDFLPFRSFQEKEILYSKKEDEDFDDLYV